MLPAAAAIELIHTYSLIHDDLPAMDDDELRRGRPTSHVVFGENVAILAGDGLFAEALRLFAEQQDGEPGLGAGGASRAPRGDRRRRHGRRAVRGRDHIDTGLLVLRRSAAESQAATELRGLHALKTGRLIAASVGVVLVLAGPSEPDTIPYRRFAEELGVLFQIVDDILDVTGSDEELGKPHGSDERHGKLTYVSLFGLERARELAAESHRKAHEALSDGGRRPPGPEPDHRLHLHPTRMSDEHQPATAARLLDQVNGPEDLKGLNDRRASGRSPRRCAS